MKYIKKFERFSPAPAPSKPAPTPTPTPTKPTRPEKPSKPEKAPERPTRRRPIETPSTDPGPIAGKKTNEMDVVTKLKETLEDKGQSLSEFVEKNKKARKK